MGMDFWPVSQGRVPEEVASFKFSVFREEAPRWVFVFSFSLLKTEH
jgi:hypothetical protein